MKHAAHKANKGSAQRTGLADLFRSSRGSHSVGVVRAVQAANGDAVALAIDPALAARLNEVAPLTRRAIRQTAKAAQRRSAVMSSASLAALVGTAATALAFSANMRQASGTGVIAQDPATTTTQMARIQGSTVSRSESRTALTDTYGTQSSTSDSTAAASSENNQTATQSSNSGSWQLNDENSTIDVSQLARSLADNPKVAVLVDKDSDQLPANFNPNHATGDSGLAYAFSQCTWWAYTRRHQLGLPVGSYFGNGAQWADSAAAMGYWVDNTPRHVGDIMVFRTGQEGASSLYGHVAIVERINPDGSVYVSECGAALNGKIAHRTFTNVSDFRYIHY
ncbi:CHAP domain-containing protein [Bifidobacterium leontopitheci]|uniref:Amidase n=1 Tax=Bifidobacterium leontopitheci TaxID=2650774 RepID=A0A6I1GFY1_9BIFI|nr:CHAP domain-containing protein [Bifidobacterium leontopitheci]KAB7790544.1 amidase [Bifidobacterium leontopitheci]